MYYIYMNDIRIPYNVTQDYRVTNVSFIQWQLHCSRIILPMSAEYSPISSQTQAVSCIMTQRRRINASSIVPQEKHLFYKWP